MAQREVSRWRQPASQVLSLASLEMVQRGKYSKRAKRCSFNLTPVSLSVSLSTSFTDFSTNSYSLTLHALVVSIVVFVCSIRNTVLPCSVTIGIPTRSTLLNTCLPWLLNCSNIDLELLGSINCYMEGEHGTTQPYRRPADTLLYTSMNSGDLNHTRPLTQIRLATPGHVFLAHIRVDRTEQS